MYEICSHGVLYGPKRAVFWLSLAVAYIFAKISHIHGRGRMHLWHPRKQHTTTGVEKEIQPKSEHFWHQHQLLLAQKNPLIAPPEVPRCRLHCLLWASRPRLSTLTGYYEQPKHAVQIIPSYAKTRNTGLGRQTQPRHVPR